MYKLLIVDDEAIEREAIKFFINRSKLRFSKIEEAINGRQAILKTRSFEPDIILMDIKMPGIDGIEATCNIRKFNSRCKIIFLTAVNEFEYAQKAIKLKVDDFVVKPAKEEVLIKILNNTMQELDNINIANGKQIDIENKLYSLKNLYETNMIMAIAMGYIKVDEQSQYFYNQYGKFQNGVCAIVRLEYEKSFKCTEFNKKRIQKRAIQKIKSEFLKHNIKFLIKALNNNIYVLVDTNKYKIDYRCNNLFEEINLVLKRELGVQTCIGVGNIFMKFEDASNSCLEAKIACNHALNHDVIYYKNLSEETIKSNYPFEEEKKLCKSIISGDEQKTRVYIENIMNWIIENEGTPKEMKKKLNQLITVVDRTINRELNLTTMQLGTFYDEIEKINSKSEMIIYFTNTISTICSYIRSLNNNPSEMLIERICLYIDKNYDKDISLDNICSMIGFSKFYFSKIFKQYRHKNFVDYLRDKRMEKSKEYLRNTQLSIKEITMKVGYTDPNYFSSVFKKTQGISPTEYKGKVIN
ncbi:hypothetical protein Z968_01415 [Clostridium novyi A str. 4552]|uniref:Stage 0 sporulation protein A homolog n=1 Tax=Clostridium novyi A str. 4552 TaxID=1444289 RepID=A0A0A0IEH4_CLONO|nr:response regulator [Clostridium novyi]KGM98010.1 hypothetical protein Z968_01415 [Clostridium novyi A str. 4552]